MFHLLHYRRSKIKALNHPLVKVFDIVPVCVVVKKQDQWHLIVHIIFCVKHPVIHFNKISSLEITVIGSFNIHLTTIQQNYKALMI